MPSVEETYLLHSVAAQGSAVPTYLSLVSRSLADTALFADGLAHVLLPGDVVLLIGDLGAGKTAFTKALARSLRIDEPITSPTFTIMRTYEGFLPGGSHHLVALAHLDAYRLEHADAIEDLGLFELLDRGAVAVIEWGDLVAEAFGTAPLVIRLSTDVGDAVLGDAVLGDVVAGDVGAGDVAVAGQFDSGLVVSDSSPSSVAVSHLVELGDGNADGHGIEVEFVDTEPRLIVCTAHPHGPWQSRLGALEAAMQSLVLPRSPHAHNTSRNTSHNTSVNIGQNIAPDLAPILAHTAQIHPQETNNPC